MTILKNELKTNPKVVNTLEGIRHLNKQMSQFLVAIWCRLCFVLFSLAGNDKAELVRGRER